MFDSQIHVTAVTQDSNKFISADKTCTYFNLIFKKRVATILPQEKFSFPNQCVVFLKR